MQVYPTLHFRPLLLLDVPFLYPKQTSPEMEMDICTFSLRRNPGSLAAVPSTSCRFIPAPPFMTSRMPQEQEGRDEQIEIKRGVNEGKVTSEVNARLRRPHPPIRSTWTHPKTTTQLRKGGHGKEREERHTQDNTPHHHFLLLCRCKPHMELTKPHADLGCLGKAARTLLLLRYRKQRSS